MDQRDQHFPAQNDHFLPSDRRELIETGVKLSNLKDDFSELKKMLADGTMKAERRLDGLEERLRGLENFRWWIVGAAGASGAVAGFMARFFHP